ncbi:MAG: protease inhibitor I42 family protein [Nanoarchaeota archaeon]|nr:protease inhibitor I42 family protein [Nanoarchaeota archaeon]
MRRRASDYRVLFMLIASVAIFAWLASSHTSYAEAEDLSNLSLVEVKVGETFKVTVKAKLTGGFVWYVDYDVNYISLVGKKTKMPESITDLKPENIEFEETFEFKAEKPGNTMLICFARGVLNEARPSDVKRFLVSITK